MIKESKSLIKDKGGILIVDDEDMIVSVSSRLIDMLGYKTFHARNGEEAIAVYRKNMNKIDIVILDMVMPGMSGGDTFDRLKEINPNIKVLLSTGYSIDGQAQEILKRGCNGFIQKPFRIKELSNKLTEILEKPNT
ncbi:MAG: response regulator [Thermodesulfobacteriota bacterium]|nr:response regulator [Thermodesulfobacteriota bacterium]